MCALFRVVLLAEVIKILCYKRLIKRGNIFHVDNVSIAKYAVIKSYFLFSVLLEEIHSQN